MGVGSAIRAIGIVGCSLVALEIAAAAGVYRCESADGSTTYSDTGCAGESDGRDTVDEPTTERAENADDESDEPAWTHARAKQAYERRRRAIIDELANLDLGPSQPPSDLLEDKARHKFLVRELERVDAGWRAYVGPGAAQRSREQRRRELEKRLQRLERWRTTAIEHTSVHFDNETYTCQRARGEISCW